MPLFFYHFFYQNHTFFDFFFLIPLESIISGEDGEAKPKPKSVKISNDTYTKYFREGVKAKEITETIEKALAFYFENMEEN